MKKLFIVLFSLGLLFMFSCGDPELNRAEQRNELAPAAPDNPNTDIGWEARDLEIEYNKTTSTHIVAWISWDAFGTNGNPPYGRTTKRKVYLEK